MDEQYRKLQEKIDAIARDEPLPQVNEDSNHKIIMGFIDQWIEAGQPKDYMADLVAYVKKTIPDSKNWNYAASLINDGVKSYQDREYGTSSLMGLRGGKTESVEEAVAGGGVDDLYELLDMGISKEDLFDEWVAYSSSDDIAEFVDHFKQMYDV